MSLLGIDSGKTGTALDIDFVGSRIDVGRMSTTPITAQMIALNIRREHLDEELIKKPMSRFGFLFVPYLPVAIGICCAGPLPTWNAIVKAFGTYLDFAKNASKKFSVNGKSVRMKAGHFANSPKDWISNLAGSIQRSRAGRAFLILSQVMQIWDNTERIRVT
jgi:hypothetical protein